MKRLAVLLIGLIGLGVTGCGPKIPPVEMTDPWPAQPGDYDLVTASWTRRAVLRGEYQEALELIATFKSGAWRAAHAVRDSETRGLLGEQLAKYMTQAQADAAGPYEVELLVTTWDRRENDLDRGKRSVWRVVLVDDQGREIEPLEITKDKRPYFTLRAEFPAIGDFATAYVARFPRTTPLFGPQVRMVRLRVSSERGAIELIWP